MEDRDEKLEVMHKCEYCGREIYEGDDYYYLKPINVVYCDKCIVKREA